MRLDDCTLLRFAILQLPNHRSLAQAKVWVKVWSPIEIAGRFVRGRAPSRRRVSALTARKRASNCPSRTSRTKRGRHGWLVADACHQSLSLSTGGLVSGTAAWERGRGAVKDSPRQSREGEWRKAWVVRHSEDCDSSRTAQRKATGSVCRAREDRSW